jgi:hypothetical protein
VSLGFFWGFTLGGAGKQHALTSLKDRCISAAKCDKFFHCPANTKSLDCDDEGLWYLNGKVYVPDDRSA